MKLFLLQTEDDWLDNLDVTAAERARYAHLKLAELPDNSFAVPTHDREIHSLLAELRDAIDALAISLTGSAIQL